MQVNLRSGDCRMWPFDPLWRDILAGALGRGLRVAASRLNEISPGTS